MTAGKPDSQTSVGRPPASWPARAGGFLRRRPALLPLAALLVLLGVNLLTTDNFSSLEIADGRLRGPMISILKDACPVMLLAAGMTVVIATAGIDLSVGSVMAIAGTVAALLLMAPGGPVAAPAPLAWLRQGGAASVPLAVAVALAVALLLGVWNGLLVAYVRLQPIIATLILLVAGRGIAQTLTSDQKVSFEVPAFEHIGMGYLLGLPVPLFIVAGVAIVLLVLLRRTAMGMYVEAVGDNIRAARMAGLKVHAVRIFAYAFSAFCAGLAGLIVTADIKLADVANCGLYLELDAILAVVIGGTSLAGGKPRLLGALLGAVIMQTLSTTLTMNNVSVGSQLMVKAAAAVGVCFLQTSFLAGLLRRALRAREAAA